MKKLNTRSGFTIVEICITLSMLAVVAGIAIPIFLKAREDSLARQRLVQVPREYTDPNGPVVPKRSERHLDADWVICKSRVNGQSVVYYPSQVVSVESSGPTPTNSLVYEVKAKRVYAGTNGAMEGVRFETFCLPIGRAGVEPIFVGTSQAYLVTLIRHRDSRDEIMAERSGNH